jgi:NitT/TauT family transport system substrate-binding protein
MKRLFLLMILLTGCCKDNRRVSLVLDWLPNPNHIPIFVGQQKGFFADEGVDLEILKAPDVVNGVLYTLSGQCDLAVTYMQTAIFAKEQGLDFDIVGKLIDRTLNGLIFVQDGTIKEPKDLSGKRLGYSVDGASDRLADILKNNQIEPLSQHNCHFDLTGMMMADQVDVLYGAYWNIESVQLKQKGLACGHFTLEELGVPNYHELIVVAKEGKNHANFQRALQKSIDFCKEHPKEAFELYFATQRDKGQETMEWEKEAWEMTRPVLPTNQDVDMAVWDEYKNWLLCSASALQ